MVDGDFLLCRSKLTFDSFRKYPFRFIIQVGSLLEKFVKCSFGSLIYILKLQKPRWNWNEPYEHVAQYLNGYIREASGKRGVVKTISSEWFKTRYPFVTIDIRTPVLPFTQNELDRMTFSWESELGQKYNFLEAPLAVLGFLIPKKFRKKSTSRSKFCSQIAVQKLQLIGRMPKDIIAKYVSPMEYDVYLGVLGFKKIDNLDWKNERW